MKINNNFVSKIFLALLFFCALATPFDAQIKSNVTVDAETLNDLQTVNTSKPHVFVKETGKYYTNINGNWVEDLSGVSGVGGGVSNGNDLMNTGETLPQAVARIGTTRKTVLEVSDLLAAIPANTTVTVTKNISLKGNAKAAINLLSGARLIIENGAGLDLNPNQKVFYGNINGVEFPYSYPTKAFPEWFGAVGNDASADNYGFNSSPTDDSDAIQAAINSFRNNSNYPTFSKYAHGGIVWIGRGYFLSKPLILHTNVILDGFGGLDYSVSRLHTPPNVPAIIAGITDVTDSVQPQPYARQGGNFQIRNILLVGEFSFVPDVTGASISGRTITKTIGGGFTGFSYRDGWALAEFVQVDGMNWALEENAQGGANGDDVFPVNFLHLRPFGFTASIVDSTHFISDRFAFPQSWVGATIQTEGTTAAATNQITAVQFIDQFHSRVTVANPILDNNGKAFTRGYFEGRVTALPAQTNKSIMLMKYHGIDVRGAGTVENVAIRGFAGDGIYCGLRNPTLNSSSQPNASNSRFINIKADFNQGSGFTVNYANGNVLELKKYNTNYNQGYGVDLDDQLGSELEGGHASFNGQYDYTAAVGQPNNNSRFQDCYREGGGMPIMLGSTATFSYGNLGGDPSYWSTGVVIKPELNSTLNIGGLTVTNRRISDNDGLFSIRKVIGEPAFPNVIESEGVSNDAEAINSSTGLNFHTRYTNYGNLNSPAIMRQFYYGNRNQGVITPTIIQEWKTSTFGGTGALMGYPNGFFVGFYGQAQVSSDAAGLIVDKNVKTTGGDLVVTDPTKGVIFKSPDNTCHRLSVSNSNVLSAATVTCP